MRHAIAVPLIALALIACRPLDVGAPIEEASSSPQSEVGAALAKGHHLTRLRVIDGDTFEMEGETIRIANIDAPEKPPRSRCAAEAGLANAATRELGDVLGVGFEGAVIAPVIEREGTDRYGRTLARVRLVSGADAGEEMIGRGYAEPWGGRRGDWCAPTR